VKTKLFCETSSVLELDNIKNAKKICETSSIFELDNFKSEASLRDPQFSELSTSKTNNSARLPSEMES
jgi:hypothetical protein